ncbi:Transposon Ty3-G Gag-Pol polyprotein [Trichinella britovi]|uniref:Transposon Ty3-G Gag-Pol polyprotein n=2 Tax=Trichinella TaxID=6333 RepID=A0A0V1C6X9_TRIBR|nr:Transposon Ty3-G Gag-Pol polyprotein [Trichinella britovi]
MSATKRELGKRGGRAGSNQTADTDAELNLQFDTGVSSFNYDRSSNPVKARNDPARESGSLQWGPVREIVVRGIGNACFGPPTSFSPEMEPVEWLESMEDFFVVTGVPSSLQATSARLSVNIAVRRELFPPGSPRDISWDELKRRFLDIYGHGESLIQLAVRFNGLKQRKNQSIREFAQEVAELGRRAGKSESELVARFICGVASKEVHRELRLREPTTLVKARQLAENVAELETESILRQHSRAISRNDDDLGRTSLVTHHIETGEARPIKQPPRRLPVAQRSVMERLVGQMLESGVIEPASGHWSSRVVLVRKKDGSPRFCVDNRRLNALTNVDAQPLLRIDDTLDALAGSQWFSTLDLASGYLQVEVAEPDREKTAFSTPMGLFQF